MNEWLVGVLIWKLVLLLVGIPAENYYNHGNHLYKLGDFKNAEYYYAKSLSCDALAARAFYNAGNAAYLQGDYLKAVEYYESSLDVASEDEDAWHNLELARRKIANQTPPQPSISSESKNTPKPPKLSKNKNNAMNKSAPSTSAASQTDQVLARARRREEVLYRFQNTGLYKKQAMQQTRDIFTQSPEEIVKTMREMTKAGYPFRPGNSLKKSAPLRDKIDW